MLCAIIRENRTTKYLRRAALAFAILSLVGVSDSEAAINFYRASKRIGYTQTSNSQPTTPAGMDGGYDLSASTPLDLFSARVFSTNPAHYSPLSPVTLTQSSPGYWGFGQSYPDLTTMDHFLPPGDTFGYLIEGGILGDRLGLLKTPSVDLFSPSVPFFTGNAFTTLNGMSALTAHTITWNMFTTLPEINDAPIFFNIYRVSDGQSMTGGGLATSTTSFLVPANTLQASTQYRAELYFSSRLDITDAGFINGDSSATFDLVTDLTFTTGSSGAGSSLTIPEPGCVTLVYAGLFVLLGLRGGRRRNDCRLLLGIVLVAWPSSANAAPDFYRVGKTVVYQQTSNTQPVTPTTVYGGVDMFTSVPADFTSARVFSTTTTPPSPVPEFVLTQFSPGYWGSSQTYANLAAMDTNLPPGDTFGFLVEGGLLGSQLALLPIPATDLFSPNVPYYTGTEFTQLNNMDTRLPFTLTWNSFTPAPTANDSPIFLSIYRVSDGQTMISTSLSNTATSFLIPANTLAPSTQYQAYLDFSSRLNTADTGFSTADATAAYDSSTGLQFTTSVYPPGDYDRNHVVNAADYVLWRKTLGQTGLVPYSGADGDGDGKILPADYNVWRTNFGAAAPSSGTSLGALAVPEPTAAALVIAGMTVLVVRNRRRHK